MVATCFDMPPAPPYRQRKRGGRAVEGVYGAMEQRRHVARVRFPHAPPIKYKVWLTRWRLAIVRDGADLLDGPAIGIKADFALDRIRIGSSLDRASRL